MTTSDHMVSVSLPSMIPVAPMKNVANLAPDLSAVEIDVSKVTPAMLLSIIQNGAKYFIDAGLSHERAKVNKGLETPRDLNIDEARKVLAQVQERFVDPSWKPRNTGAEPMSDFERAVRELIRPRFYDLGVIRRANKKMDVKAFTLEDFLADFETTEDAVRDVARKQISAAADYSPEKLEAQVEASWVALSVKAKRLAKAWEAERKLKETKLKESEDGEHLMHF